MNKRIPISAAEKIAKTYDYDQVIVYARTTGENGLEWITTYGVNKVHCDAAARIGDCLGRNVVKPLEELTARAENAEAALKASAGWCSDMSSAPLDKRILIKSDPSGEVFAAHWVKNIETDDEAWLISEAPDGSQHLCKAKAWRLIPTDTEATQ